MTTTQLTPLSIALASACLWLNRRKELRADPQILLEFVQAWLVTAGPVTVEEAQEIGEFAVKECACCRKELIDMQEDFNELPAPWLNPEDLID